MEVYLLFGSYVNCENRVTPARVFVHVVHSNGSVPHSYFGHTIFLVVAFLVQLMDEELEFLKTFLRV